MKLLLTLLFGSFFFSALSAPLLVPSGDVIDGEYIVKLHDDVDLESHLKELRVSFGSSVRVLFTYENLPGFTAFSAILDDDSLSFQLNHENVEYVEKNQKMYASQACHLQTDATWGLDRIAEHQIDLDGKYHYDQSGKGITAFIIDTGIYVENNDFGGRAVWGPNFSGDGKKQDCNGHGTHVASTVGGTTYGVAKSVSLEAVKVLGCDGSGSNAGVIAGVDYAGSKGKDKDVVNMSLGGGKSTALNEAVEKAVQQGVVFVVAAGNDNQDACSYSPASEAAAITVGATAVAEEGTKQEDIRSSFSNYGSCLDIFAPGTGITAAWIGSPNAINTISGTSMASPHVCGVAAIIRSANPTMTPSQVVKHMEQVATNDTINQNCGWLDFGCSSSPNRLAYSSC